MHYFHVELDTKWLVQHQVKLADYEGHVFFDHPIFRKLFYRIYKEFRIGDSVSQLAIEGLLLQAFCELKRVDQKSIGESPDWIRNLNEFLQANYAQPISLETLSNQCGRSPVYLSQIFPRYFKATFGAYLRKIRIEKATQLLVLKDRPLAQVAYETGFSDQSHFIRCFKEIHGLTPGEYSKIIG